MHDSDCRESQDPGRKNNMHDQGLPDVRGEDLANLVANHVYKTALDRVISLDGSSNQFNNFISAVTESPTDSSLEQGGLLIPAPAAGAAQDLAAAPFEQGRLDRGQER
jgi:hypothetical protein